MDNIEGRFNNNMRQLRADAARGNVPNDIRLDAVEEIMVGGYYYEYDPNIPTAGKDAFARRLEV